MAVIVHSSDLHIDSPVDAVPGTPVGQARAASRRAVIRLVDLVLRERADLLIISGDVFDRAADSHGVGRFFAAQLDRLAQVGIPALVAAGNHDVVCPAATAGAAGVRWFPAAAPATVRFDRLRLAVHGQGLADPAEPRDLSATFPAPLPGYLNLGVLHTSLDGRLSRTACAPTSVSGLARTGYAYWALGHVHQRWVVSTVPWVVYPGSPHGRCPGQRGPAGVTLLTTGPAGTVEAVEHRPLGLPAREPGPAWPRDARSRRVTAAGAAVRGQRQGARPRRRQLGATQV